MNLPDPDKNSLGSKLFWRAMEYISEGEFKHSSRVKPEESENEEDESPERS